MIKIEHAKVQALRNWAKSLKSVTSQREKLTEKINKLQAEIAPLDQQVGAYNSLIEATFGSEFKGLTVTDLVISEKVEGATIYKLNPKYIVEETTERTDKNGKIVKSTTYYYNTPESTETGEENSQISESVGPEGLEPENELEPQIEVPEEPKPETTQSKATKSVKKEVVEEPEVKDEVKSPFDDDSLLDTL